MPVKSLNDKMARIQFDRIPILISQYYASVSRNSDNATDTAWSTLYSVTVPAGTMNLNGKIVIEQDWKFTASVSQKQLRVDWGGGWVSGPFITNSSSVAFFDTVIKNKNSLTSQFLVDMAATGYGTGGSGQEVLMFADTTKDVAIDFKCSWGANVASEQITLRGFSIWYYPGNS